MPKSRLTVLTAIVAALAVSTVAFGQVKQSAKPAAKPATTAKPAAKTSTSPKTTAKPAAPVKSPIDQLAAAGPDAVVAVVNGEKITKKQLTDFLWGSVASKALDQSVVQAILIKQKAKAAGVTVTQKDIDDKISEIQQGLQGKTVDQALAEMGMSKQVWIESQLKPGILAEKVISKGITTSDTDIAQFVRARHILIRTKPGQTDAERTKNAEEAKAKIESIAAEIKGGLDFAAAADKYTEDPSGQGKGGELPWFKSGRMVKEFEDAVFALKPGEISAPVETKYGYHLIKLEKLGKDATPAEKAEIKQQLVDEKKMEAQQKFYTDLMTNAKIESKLKVAPIAPPQSAAVKAPAPRPTRPVPPAQAPKPAANTNAQPATQTN